MFNRKEKNIVLNFATVDDLTVSELWEYYVSELNLLPNNHMVLIKENKNDTYNLIYKNASEIGIDTVELRFSQNSLEKLGILDFPAKDMNLVIAKNNTTLVKNLLDHLDKLGYKFTVNEEINENKVKNGMRL